MLTFPTPVIKAISLLPLSTEETAGRFRVWLFLSLQESPILVWDRKIEGGFPELKALVCIPRLLESPPSIEGQAEAAYQGPCAAGHIIGPFRQKVVIVMGSFHVQ
jgi:predicted Rdx family selenoprotein